MRKTLLFAFLLLAHSSVYAHKLELISISLDGKAAGGCMGRVDISDDGRYVVFSSNSANPTAKLKSYSIFTSYDPVNWSHSLDFIIYDGEYASIIGPTGRDYVTSQNNKLYYSSLDDNRTLTEKLHRCSLEFIN